MDLDIKVGVSDATATIEHSLPPLQSRYMLTQVGQQQLVFPSQWVSEIMLIERSQVLNLPFYDRMLLGLVHYNGNIVPLLSAHLLLLKAADQAGQSRTLKETLTVLRLSVSVDKLAGVGIVVDHVVASLPLEQLAGQRLFKWSDIPDDLWQPRW